MDGKIIFRAGDIVYVDNQDAYTGPATYIEPTHTGSHVVRLPDDSRWWVDPDKLTAYSPPMAGEGGPAPGTPTTAQRYNTNKPHLSYVPMDAVEAESWVWFAGRKKYPRDERNATMLHLGNWERLWGDNTVELVLDCAMRHIQKLLQGQWTEVQRDGDGNIIYHEDGTTPVITQHAASVRSNMAMLIRYFNENIRDKEETTSAG